MKPSEALELHREEIREIVGKYRVTNPRIFGSVLHGDDTEDSDLDILVDPIKGKTSMFDIAGLEIELQDFLHIKVDILTPNGLPKKFRDEVVEEAISV